MLARALVHRAEPARRRRIGHDALLVRIRDVEEVGGRRPRDPLVAARPRGTALPEDWRRSHRSPRPARGAAVDRGWPAPGGQMRIVGDQRLPSRAESPGHARTGCCRCRRRPNASRPWRKGAWLMRSMNSRASRSVALDSCESTCTVARASPRGLLGARSASGSVDAGSNGAVRLVSSGRAPRRRSPAAAQRPGKRAARASAESRRCRTKAGRASSLSTDTESTSVHGRNCVIFERRILRGQRTPLTYALTPAAYALSAARTSGESSGNERARPRAARRTCAIERRSPARLRPEARPEYRLPGGARRPSETSDPARGRSPGGRSRRSRISQRGAARPCLSVTICAGNCRASCCDVSSVSRPMAGSSSSRDDAAGATSPQALMRGSSVRKTAEPRLERRNAIPNSFASPR